MAEKPILFSGELVRAILDDRKTVTRRLTGLTSVPRSAVKRGVIVESTDRSAEGAWAFEDPAQPWMSIHARCPYGVSGDTLWVRETFAVPSEFDHVSPSKLPKRARESVIYRADGDELPAGYTRWRPSIHMPRWASRLSLRVVSVRPDRLQDITPDEVLREGVVDAYKSPEQLIAMWVDLWDRINPAHPWASNPWVWRVEFARERDE